MLPAYQGALRLGAAMQRRLQPQRGAAATCSPCQGMRHALSALCRDFRGPMTRSPNAPSIRPLARCATRALQTAADGYSMVFTPATVWSLPRARKCQDTHLTLAKRSSAQRVRTTLFSRGLERQGVRSGRRQDGHEARAWPVWQATAAGAHGRTPRFSAQYEERGRRRARPEPGW